ncbi:hypothetical protein ISN44_As01g011050 [Arabidopsis suecica]|uniref:Uncharacterized protein n=1 Tax=Arabidopsis suecica TaxID=45249 RepID=A0A8T2H2V6_ARASU|nr:hypothetical protein ISN44_As01g011050 [Arabidopsis suecica]
MEGRGKVNMINGGDGTRKGGREHISRPIPKRGQVKVGILLGDHRRQVTGENKAQPSGTKSIRTQSHTISVSKAIQSFDYSQSLNKKKYLKILYFSCSLIPRYPRIMDIIIINTYAL